MTFYLRVYGLPVPKASAQARLVGGRAVVYTKKKDRAWKDVVKQQVIEAVVGDQPWLPWLGPVALTLKFYLARPASLPKRIEYPTKKPDCSNLTKTVEDALKGLVYKDDAQVVCLTVRKVYHARPGVEIFADLWEADLPVPRALNPDENW